MDDRGTDTDRRTADRLNMLRFRASRRGFLEADLILGPFAARHVGEMTPQELDEFETLLDQPDQDLYGWIVGLKPMPRERDTPLMARICDFRFAAFKVREALGAQALDL